MPPLSEAQWHELELTLRADLGEPTRRAIIGKSEAYVVATALRESARKKAKLPGRGRRKSSPLSVLQHVMADCAAAWRKADADEASAMALAELGAEVSVRGGIDLQKLQSEIEATASRLGAYVERLSSTAIKPGPAPFDCWVGDLRDVLEAAGIRTTRTGAVYETDKKPSPFQRFVDRLHRHITSESVDERTMAARVVRALKV